MAAKSKTPAITGFRLTSRDRELLRKMALKLSQGRDKAADMTEAVRRAIRNQAAIDEVA